MTLNANQPSDQVLVSELPAYIRAVSAAFNTIQEGSDSINVTTLSISSGDIVLVVGTDLSANKIEVVFISGIGPVVLEYIQSGIHGQIKLFIFQDSDVSFKDGIKEDGKLYLNHLPALSNFDAETDDILALVNVGGDGIDDSGYWKELFRTQSVK